MLPGLSVGGMVWQRLSFATAASDMGTKRDQTQASDNGVVNLMGLGVRFFVVVQDRWMLLGQTEALHRKWVTKY